MEEGRAIALTFDHAYWETGNQSRPVCIVIEFAPDRHLFVALQARRVAWLYGEANRVNANRVTHQEAWSGNRDFACEIIDLTSV